MAAEPQTVQEYIQILQELHWYRQITKYTNFQNDLIKNIKLIQECSRNNLLKQCCTKKFSNFAKLFEKLTISSDPKATLYKYTPNHPSEKVKMTPMKLWKKLWKNNLCDHTIVNRSGRLIQRTPDQCSHRLNVLHQQFTGSDVLPLEEECDVIQISSQNYDKSVLTMLNYLNKCKEPLIPQIGHSQTAIEFAIALQLTLVNKLHNKDHSLNAYFVTTKKFKTKSKKAREKENNVYNHMHDIVCNSFVLFSHSYYSLINYLFFTNAYT